MERGKHGLTNWAATARSVPMSHSKSRFSIGLPVSGFIVGKMSKGDPMRRQTGLIVSLVNIDTGGIDDVDVLWNKSNTRLRSPWTKQMSSFLSKSGAMKPAHENEPRLVGA